MELSTEAVVVILAVVAVVLVAMGLPGWAAVGWAFARRRRDRTGSGGGWAFVAGSLTGLALCCAVAVAGWTVATGVGAGGVLPLLVLSSWAACWSVAWLVARTGRSGPGAVSAEAVQEGWGR